MDVERLDLSKLLAVCTGNGVVDEGLLLELLVMFLSDNRARLSELATEAGAGNAEAVRRLAHTVSGSASTAGAAQLAILTKAIENDARDGRLPSATAVDAATREFADVQAALLSRFPALNAKLS